MAVQYSTDHVHNTEKNVLVDFWSALVAWVESVAAVLKVHCINLKLLTCPSGGNSVSILLNYSTLMIDCAPSI
jgi:hypothetical protein